MAVPMRAGSRPAGALCVWRRRREPFADADEALLQELADIAARALANARVHAETVARLQILEQEHRAAKERERLADRTLELHSELTRIAMEGDDVAAVLRAVGTRVGGAAVVVTDDGRVVCWQDPSTQRDVARELSTWAEAEADGPAPGEVIVLDAEGGCLLVTPVRAGGVTFGHLGLACARSPAIQDSLAAQQAAMASALLLAREDAAVTAVRRAQSEFVWDLLEGRIPGEVEAAVRANHIGAGFRLPARVIAVEVKGLLARAELEGWTADRTERTRGSLVRHVARRLDSPVRRHAVIASRGELLAVVVPMDQKCSEAECAKLAKLFRSVEWPAEFEIRVGIGGRIEQIRRLRGGWREARLALSAAQPDGYAAFEDLGILQFLLAPTRREDLNLFAQRRLGPLMTYDAEHGTDLIPTVSAFFAAECSTRKTAERLFVHHRTVSYRLQRVEELTGLNLGTQEDRLEVQFALKVMALPSGDGDDLDD